MFPKKDDLEATPAFGTPMPPATAYGGSAYGSAAYVSAPQGVTYGATTYPTTSYSVAAPVSAPRVRVPSPPPSGTFVRAPYRASAKPLLETNGIPFPKQGFICLGALIVFMLLVMPMYEAIRLTHNWNYVYWHGLFVPYTSIILCLVCFFGWLTLSACAFSGERLAITKKSDLAIATATMATIVGLILLFVSIIGSTQSFSVRMALSNTCESNIQTRAVRAWYQMALELRKKPECAGKYTIEDCDGFQPLSKWKKEYYYYKQLEHSFQCSGFCFEPPSTEQKASLVSVANASSAGKGALHSSVVPSLISQGAKAAKVRSSSTTFSNATANYPPTLFSDANFHKVSCQGAAALNLYFTVVSHMEQMWWLGIILVGSAVVITLADQLSMIKTV